MKTRHLLPIAALGGMLLLSGCGQTGPLPTFGKAITPEWIKADFDGQPGDEYIATSNLQDVVFNARGEVIGWYVKGYAGTPYIKKRADGTYDFSALTNQKGIVNMVAGRKALAVEDKATGLNPAQPAETSTPTGLTTDMAAHRQDAVFRYTQGGATVTKTVTLHPRNFKVDLKTEVTGGPERVNILFPGLGKADNPRVQAYAQGGAQPATVQGSGTLTVENIQYAALQENPSQVAHALMILPQGGTQVNATLTGGSQGLITASVPASSTLEIYGGKNELIHLYQSGYTDLPGLFKPNFFGQISLLIVKLMEQLYKLIGNWGLVLVVLTILLRAIMWPLMQAQGRTTARMQVMQPRIKEIQDKYKDKNGKDRIDNFEERVLKPAKAALDESCPYTFNYVKVRENPNNKRSKVTGFRFYPVYQPQFRDEELEGKELQAKVTARYQIDSHVYEYLRYSCGFTSEEINRNKETFITAQEKITDLIGELALLNGKSREKNNPKGWIINALKGKIKDK